MTIEIQFNSVMFDIKELQEQYPELAMMINSSLPRKKTKRRKRKKKQTVACLIDEIIENINRE